MFVIYFGGNVGSKNAVNMPCTFILYSVNRVGKHLMVNTQELWSPVAKEDQWQKAAPSRVELQFSAQADIR